MPGSSPELPGRAGDLLMGSPTSRQAANPPTTSPASVVAEIDE